jgi:hypothetical protein
MTTTKNSSLRRGPTPPATPLERLIDNAFYFLSGALRQIKDDPQRSVIDFYTAVELFLKARLLREHWTLIVTKDPDIGLFKKGDFASVTFDEACNRIRRVLGQQIPQAARDAFDAVRQHRNRMVHFFHPDDPKSKSSSIALEQLKAWHHLNRLITGEWSAALPNGVAKKAAAIERSLVHHREYAQERFNHLKPELVAEAKAGAVFVDCPSCTMKAAQLNNERAWLRSYTCRVCASSWSEMDLDCPECGKLGLLKSYEGFTCKRKACKHTVPAEEVYDLLDDEPTTHDNYMDAQTPANCDECQGHHTVCSHEGEFLCTTCLAVFDQLYACEWCGEFGTESRDNSEWTGCEHCDGKLGHIRDE